MARRRSKSPAPAAVADNTPVVATSAARGGVLIPILVIALAAFAVRLAYFSEIRDVGFIGQPVSDGRVYDERARGVVAGDWLGPADFVHAPLYAYTLAAVYFVAGEGPWPLRVFQAMCGAVACVLVLLTARRLFDGRIGLLAGWLLACYPPALFFDGLLQKASLTLLLSTLLLYLAVRAAQRPSIVRWGAVGLASGLLILNRQNTLALVPLLIAWALAPAAAGPLLRRRLAHAGVMLVALALALLPWAARNRAVIGSWTLTTPNFGQNFAMGNHPDATGTYLPFKRGRASAEFEQAEWTRAAEQALGRELTPAEVSDYYFDAAWTWIISHPAAWLRLTAWKTLLTWNAYEAPDTEDYYVFRRSSSILGGLDPVWHFGVLAPLAIAGLWIGRRKWRVCWPLYVWLPLTTAAIALFVVFARYRLPLIPVLVVFAAVAIAETAARLGRRDLGRLAWPAAFAVGAALAANVQLLHTRDPSVRGLSNHAVALADQGRYAAALAEVDAGLALAPEDVDSHAIRGSVLLDLGRYDDALTAYWSAQQGDPDYAAALRGVGDALTGLQRLAEAAEYYARAATLDPDDPRTLNALGGNLARRGRPAEALTLLKRALASDPAYAEAHLNLGNVYLTLNRPGDAISAYDRALNLNPVYVDAWLNRAVAELARGDRAAADEALQQAERLAPTRADIRALRGALRSAGAAPAP